MAFKDSRSRPSVPLLDLSFSSMPSLPIRLRSWSEISKNEANPLIQTIKIYPFKQYLNNFKKNQFKI